MDRRSPPRSGCSRARLQASSPPSSTTTILIINPSTRGDRDSRREVRVESKPSQNAFLTNLVSSSGNLGESHRLTSTTSLLPSNLKINNLFSPTPL